MRRRRTSGRTIPADPNVKNFSYAVVDGEVYYRENSVMVKLDLNATAERVKGMVELRDSSISSSTSSWTPNPDDVSGRKQQKLNRRYDASPRNTGLSTAGATPSPLPMTAPTTCSALWKCWTMRTRQARTQGGYVHQAHHSPSSAAVTSVDTPAKRWRSPFGESLRGYGVYVRSSPAKPARNHDELRGVIFRVDPMQGTATLALCDSR